jgi:predicted RNase H-like nuclease (RuvC/YqgF family)
MDEIIMFVKDWLPLVASGIAVYASLRKTKHECKNIEGDTSDTYAGMSLKFSEEVRKLRDENAELWEENRTLKIRFNMQENQFITIERELKSVKMEFANKIEVMRKENEVLRKYNKMLVEKLALNDITIPEAING